ncbi:MAG: RDD family protein [Campylobacteraceae bacterium]|nr:RDD family protein [Campylobacteraceae bacterium]MBT3882598.1 RDD family protein [Campylobacteraceae bacterium]MBT4030076.1 RDD family protein [Campylobacteraceae bacterium]MBT4178613.1 RDD family protein [Campylobacteraceae bacterium]MBT4572959.1 RDD family protein [Campylobacteraceae bacterium]
MDTNSLELATTRTRTTAFIIDDLLITLVAVIMLWDQISASGGEFINILTIMNQAFIQIIFMKVIYQTYFIWYYGATIGKTIMKLKVIDFNHLGRVTFIQALIRSMGRIISESFFYIGFLMAFYTESRQTLHDKFGKTLVVNA